MPYAELLEFNQPNPIRRPGFTRIRDAFPGLDHIRSIEMAPEGAPGNPVYTFSDPERIIEFAGRWDYGPKNAAKLGEMSKLNGVEVPIIQKYIGMGHESMIEMGDATFFIECSRVVSHQLVRHRPMSVQQESQRFVKYDDENIEIFYLPDVSDEDEDTFGQIYSGILDTYKKFREQGMPPQLARYILPNATRTRMIVKANIRQWRHILKLRMDKSAQPEMSELMEQIYIQLMDAFQNALIGVTEGPRGVR